MRDLDEIYKAHDLLVAVILGRIPNPWADANHADLIRACDVLCWVLQHDHNQTFANNLAGAYDALQAMGIEQVAVIVQ